MNIENLNLDESELIEQITSKLVNPITPDIEIIHNSWIIQDEVCSHILTGLSLKKETVHNDVIKEISPVSMKEKRQILNKILNESTHIKSTLWPLLKSLIGHEQGLLNLSDEIDCVFEGKAKLSMESLDVIIHDIIFIVILDFYVQKFNIAKQDRNRILSSRYEVRRNRALSYGKKIKSG